MKSHSIWPLGLASWTYRVSKPRSCYISTSLHFFFLLLSLKKRQDVSSTLFTNLPACSTHPTWHREDQRAVSILFVVVNYKHHVVRQVPKTFYSHITDTLCTLTATFLMVSRTYVMRACVPVTSKTRGKGEEGGVPLCRTWLRGAEGESDEARVWTHSSCSGWVSRVRKVHSTWP